jgi:acyl-CoA reductase-like NAD-dependent aldehyde dehydrogenase
MRGAAEHLTPVTLELGGTYPNLCLERYTALGHRLASRAHSLRLPAGSAGKNPVFVDATADLDMAAKRTLWGRNMNAGVLTSRCVGAVVLALCGAVLRVGVVHGAAGTALQACVYVVSISCLPAAGQQCISPDYVLVDETYVAV